LNGINETTQNFRGAEEILGV